MLPLIGYTPSVWSFLGHYIVVLQNVRICCQVWIENNKLWLGPVTILHISNYLWVSTLFSGNVEAVKVLVENGISCSVGTCNGRTVLLFKFYSTVIWCTFSDMNPLKLVAFIVKHECFWLAGSAFGCIQRNDQYSRLFTFAGRSMVRFRKKLKRKKIDGHVLIF